MHANQMWLLHILRVYGLMSGVFAASKILLVVIKLMAVKMKYSFCNRAVRCCLVRNLGQHAKDQPVLTLKVEPCICDPSLRSRT